uniref:Structure-specific endonuclease subunit SLX4 n=1 Tax=Labrus bergylta TaxID=56723 RepID=A0A3Q3MEW4_9LABR
AIMDDSDQDFADLCSKLLKRVRKRPGESRQARREEQLQPSNQAVSGDKTRRNNRRHGETGSRSAETQPVSKDEGGDQPVSKDEGGDQPVSKGAGGDQPVSKGAGGDQPVSKGAGGDQPVDGPCINLTSQRVAQWPQVCDNQLHVFSFTSGLSSEPLDSDEALALRLQQELDREAAESRTVDLEEGGLFFCQICHRDLSHMTPEGRMQHLNRSGCLDENEQGAQALAPPPPPPPGVPECPICGKKFKSQKSRSAHLKRCSADLGVPPAVLLQAVPLLSSPSSLLSLPSPPLLSPPLLSPLPSSPLPSPSSPLPSPSSPLSSPPPLLSFPPPLLSSSLLSSSPPPLPSPPLLSSPLLSSPLLSYPPSSLLFVGKGRGKRKKGAAPRPPLLLLVQDANTALTRLQDRVSALLLQGRSPSPPTPTHCPSSLPGWSGAAPLWQKSTLQDGVIENDSDMFDSTFLISSCYVQTFSIYLLQERSRIEQMLNPSPFLLQVQFSKLASDLSSMVNNPQLSDVQLQVDSGDVFFAHSFMVYARCPLLAQMVHESGFGVQEEGVPAAQRVLISDVPGQAVLALLRYVYSAHCCVPAPLRPHVRELASSRFDLQELQQLCELHREDAAAEGDDEEDINNQTEQALVELLRSMWNEEDAEEEEEEIHEEKVNEEELEEIYEFAATQRKREGEQEGVEEEEERADEEEEEVFTKLTEPRRSVKNLKQNSQLKPDLSLDRSYSRLFSDSWGVYESSAVPSTVNSPSCRSHQRSHSASEPELTSPGRRHEEEEVERESDDREQEEAKMDANEADFMVMDEPPIAFNDSWGLDACAEANPPGCFSLRLEDSGGSSLQDQSTGPGKTPGSSSSTDCQPSPAALGARSPQSRGSVSNFPSSKAHSAQPCDQPTPETNSLLDSKIWDSWQEDQEEALPLSQRLLPSAQLKTPGTSNRPLTKRVRNIYVCSLTLMHHYGHFCPFGPMFPLHLVIILSVFGVRPLPKRQMILKLKEIHQYTHQLVHSDSDGEAPSVGGVAQVKPPPSRSSAAGSSRPASCAQTGDMVVQWLALSPHSEEVPGLNPCLSGLVALTPSSLSLRSNPELCVSSEGDSDSDGGISASQVASRLQDRLQAVRSFILSDSALYTQILQYQPVVLSQLQERLKAAGIRLGAAKLVDYLDSQCITFTTAKPGHSAPNRRRGKKAARGGGAGRKKVAEKNLTASI